MKTEPVWVLDETVERIHQFQIAEHGGNPGLRDANLLESALVRPKQLFHYADEEIRFSRLAAAYAYGIARNHPFIDGNKRTAFVVCLLFLGLNGYQVIATQTEKYQTFLGLADGSLSENQLGDWLEAHIRPC